MTVSWILGILMLTVLLTFVALSTFFFYRKERKAFAQSEITLALARRHSLAYVESLDKVIQRHPPSRELQAILAATSAVMLSEAASRKIMQNFNGNKIDRLYDNNDLTTAFADIHGICISDETIKDDLAELIYNSVKYVSLRWDGVEPNDRQITMTLVKENLEYIIKLIVKYATSNGKIAAQH